MVGCLDDDHRKGLILALQQLAAGHYALTRVAQSVGQSTCTDDEEYGGLFDPSTTAYQRSQRLADISMRSPARAYAFMISAAELADVASRDIAFWRIDQRFDDNGLVTPTGRYEVTGWSSGIWVNNSQFEQRYRVVDHTDNKSVDFMNHGYFTLQNGTVSDWQSGFWVNPSSTSDPLLQTIANAAQKYLSTTGGHTINIVDPTFDALQAIDLAQAPSLSGWPMPFAYVVGDSAGDIVAQGGSI
jgi:hypothetical protein